MRSGKILFAGLWLSLLAGHVAVAATPTPQRVVEHHISALKQADIDQLVADYAPDAVVVLSIGTFSGLTQIRKMFETYFAQDKENAHSAWDATAEPQPNGLVIEHWTFYRGQPQENSGTDVIVVRNGKIQFHSMGPDAACPAKSK
jgi:ketosteroid isomerase-like protein